ncbi:MAG: protoglobin domain-containing protein [Hyphomicrobiales bacterium]|nr:protoglobin domain-containing protein [Hyphomicrobiales bacterium]
MEFSDRMRDFGLGPDQQDRLRAWSSALLGHVETAVEAYYAHLAGTAFAEQMRASDIDEIKAMRVAHWRLLVGGDFVGAGRDYADRFGRRLLDGGFPRSIFVFAAEWFALEFTARVDADPAIPDAERPGLRDALIRAAFFDLALAESARDIAWID